MNTEEIENQYELMVEQPTEVIDYDMPKWFAKSNQFIRAKYKTSLLEKKIINIALSKLEEKNGEIYAIMTVQEIRGRLGVKGNGVYNQLKEVSKSTLGHIIHIEDEDKSAFTYFNMANQCTYANGQFKVTFNNALKPFIKNLTADFTRMNLTTLCSFSSDVASSFYELLKADYDKGRAIYKRDVITKKYGLSELKIQVGVVNAEAPAVSRALQKGIDYDTIVNDISKEKTYNRWSHFKERVLDTAQKELDKSEYSEIKFTYDLEKAGKGGKVVAVIFHIFKNEKYVLGERTTKAETGTQTMGMEQSDMLNEELIRDVVELIEEPITRNNAIILLKEAAYNLEIIALAYAYSKKQTEIGNLVGWLRQCIANEWYKEDEIITLKGCTYERALKISELYEDYNSEESQRELREEFENRKKIKEKEKEVKSFASVADIDLETLSEEEIAILLQRIKEKNKNLS